MKIPGVSSRIENTKDKLKTQVAIYVPCFILLMWYISQSIWNALTICILIPVIIFNSEIKNWCQMTMGSIHEYIENRTVSSEEADEDNAVIVNHGDNVVCVLTKTRLETQDKIDSMEAKKDGEWVSVPEEVAKVAKVAEGGEWVIVSEKQ